MGQRLRLIFALVLTVLDPAFPAERSDNPDLTEVSLEELMEIQVTSVSKLPEKRSTAAAALYVITGEDIDRSGVTSIPEALRMAPGVHVARIDSNKWAVSIRGFGGQFTNKLLVLMDGRSVYTPLFGGVFWDVQDTLLEDIDRIEVIRGPGGALWGANAVNGVINVITKSARETHGALVSGGGGSEERDFASFRYGGQLGGEFHYRLYGKYFDRDAGFNQNGKEFDDWSVGRLGFRSDWDLNPRDTLTVQGDLYDGEVGELLPSISATERRTDLAGGNMLARWQHALQARSDFALQLYYDRTTRDDPTFKDDQDTADLDLQYRLPLFGNQELLWGAGYRLTADQFHGGSIVDLVPKSRENQLASAFVQDQIPLVGDSLKLTLGTKIERNDYTGFEVQPSGRMAWTPVDHHTLWGAVSRAVRTPSREEANLLVSADDPESGVTFELLGNRHLHTEDLIAFETGYRAIPKRGLLFDVTGFYNVYDNLVTFETGPPVQRQTPRGEQTSVPIIAGNRMNGEVYGVEIAADWLPIEAWRLNASYSLLQVDLQMNPGSTDQSSIDQEKASPRHQAHFGSSLNLPGKLRLDLFLRYVDSLPIPTDHTPSYVTFDTRLAWLPWEFLDLSVTGQNLAQAHHKEFAGGTFAGEPFGGGTEVERGVYGKIRWRF